MQFSPRRTWWGIARIVLSRLILDVDLPHPPTPYIESPGHGGLTSARSLSVLQANVVTSQAGPTVARCVRSPSGGRVRLPLPGPRESGRQSGSRIGWRRRHSTLR